MKGYIHPSFRNDPEAEAFDAFLDEHLDWSVEDFGGDYAWCVPVPERSEWIKAAADLNKHLATLSE